MKTNITILIIAFTLITFSNSSAQFDFFKPKTTIAGYGELHYNYKKHDDNISKTLDFHRFVIFFGYSFSEKWSFKSEVEIEHNFVSGGNGELSLEQAFIDYHYKDYLGFQAGVLLASVGLINDNHEPVLFFGVERPEYAKYIIPTTWFGNGFSVYGNYSGLQYKLNIMEGLNSDKFSLGSGIRSGRQKGYKSDASAMMYNFNVNYLDINGLKVGGSVVYNDAVGDTSNVPFTMFEVHADYRKNGFVLVGEYGNISYEQSNLEQSSGYYVDFGYDFSRLLGLEWKTIPFIRYSEYNTAASTVNGGDETKANHYSAWMVGISVLPLDNIVLKADYSENTIELNSDKTEYFNLGIGYRF
jgi:hypothetical protein